MQKFLEAIVKRISVEYAQLSIIKNPDGFLKDRGVQQAIGKEFNVCFVCGTAIELRCHYEIVLKNDRSTKYCYLIDDSTRLLPDMLKNAFEGRFIVGDLFPNFVDKNVLRGLSLETIIHLYENNTLGFVSGSEARMKVMAYEYSKGAVKKINPDDYIFRLREVDVAGDFKNWIPKVADVVKEAVAEGFYTEIKSSIASINRVFQESILSRYNDAVVSNHMLRARAVNKVLPHLKSKYSSSDKVALVVVDGMAYWQYQVLKEHLKGFNVEDNVIFSWMPSITMLSRQALFRGDVPMQDYKQNPSNECKLWIQFWQAAGIASADIQYIYDGDDLDAFSTTKRLALVTNELDDKMHASTDNSDLMALTENWARRFAPKIKYLKDCGFTIYLTTDHGNVLSEGWRSLNSQEKTFLYKDGSRGTRHLIYDSLDEMRTFVKSNDEVGLLQYQNWVVMCGDKCFKKAGQEMITHGGSHFMEVLIPFVKI